jgi:rhodanese-related sulfurtransferase
MWPGAKSVPLHELEARLPGSVKNKAVPLVLVCAVGACASRAVAIARKLGYENAQVAGRRAEGLARRGPAGRAKA